MEAGRICGSDQWGGEQAASPEGLGQGDRWDQGGRQDLQVGWGTGKTSRSDCGGWVEAGSTEAIWGQVTSTGRTGRIGGEAGSIEGIKGQAEFMGGIRGIGEAAGIYKGITGGGR